MQIKPFLKKLRLIGLERKIPNITERNGEFIGKILQEKNPKNILEIGTANGYSSIFFSQYIPEKTKIFTIEFAWNAHIEAVENFHQTKQKNIIPLWGDAKKIIPIFQDKIFDIVYIDAMKREYLDYLLLVIPKITKNGIIIIDDVEKFAHKMQNLYQWLNENTIKYTLHKTDEDDSIMIIKQKEILTKII